MRKFDVVILGSHVGGIMAGALLTKKGFSVLMLEEKVKARSARGKYRFRRFSNLSELVVSRTLVEGVYGLLDLRVERGEFSARRDLGCQVLLPGHRVDISPHRANLLEEIRREFPRDFEFIETLYARVEGKDWLGPILMTLGDEPPFIGQIRRWFAHEYRALCDKRVSTILTSHGGDRAFNRFIDVQMKSMSYILVDDPPFALASHLLGILLKDEAYTDMVNSRGFMDRIKGEMARGGGRIKALDSFGTIRVEKSGGEFRVYTNGERNPFLSRVFLGDIPFARLRGLFPKAFSGRGWLERAERLWPEYFIFSLHLGVDGGGLPVGLGDCFMSLRDLNGPDANGNLLMVFVGPEGVDAPPGKRSVTANAFVPVTNGKTGTTGTEGVAGAILSHLSEVAPFLDRSIRVIYDQPSQERYQSEWNNGDIIYGTTSSFRVGDAILPTVTPMEGLFLACRENFPYLGFEGEILSGMRAAQAVWNRFR